MRFVIGVGLPLYYNSLVFLLILSATCRKKLLIRTRWDVPFWAATRYRFGYP